MVSSALALQSSDVELRTEVDPKLSTFCEVLLQDGYCQWRWWVVKDFVELHLAPFTTRTVFGVCVGSSLVGGSARPYVKTTLFSDGPDLRLL